MTKEEVLQIIKAVAKEMLDETPSHFDAEAGDEVYSDMGRVNVILEFNKKLCAAVESLPDVPDTNDGDMISRKAVIEALKEALNPSITNFVKAKIAIDKLPSAQPEIIRCRDCKYWQDQEEEVVEVPICARPENKYEKFPFVMLIGGDGFCSYAERKENR